MSWLSRADAVCRRSDAAWEAYLSRLLSPVCDLFFATLPIVMLGIVVILALL